MSSVLFQVFWRCGTIVVFLFALGLSSFGASYDFGPWPAAASPEKIGIRVSKNFVSRSFWNFNQSGPANKITYPESCTWYGALRFSDVTSNKALTGKLVARFERLRRKQLAFFPDGIDNDSFGAVAFELSIQLNRHDCFEIGKLLADAEWQFPKESDLLKLSPATQKRVHEMERLQLYPYTTYRIDDMYTLTILQVQAFRATGDKKYLDRAARQMVAYIDVLQRSNGLFYHTPGAPHFWGRGNGWMAAGMTEILLSLPQDHPDRSKILASYKLMMEGLLKCQDAGGLWRQLIDDPKSWIETSGSGMFVYAFITGLNEGWLEGTAFGPAARKGWLGLVSYLDTDGNVREVCEGTAPMIDRESYLNRKRYTGDMHGQAPVLWCATALLKK